MQINNIQVICLPCPKCKALIEYIEDSIRQIEIEKKINIIYSFEHIKHFKQASKYGVSASQAPIMLVNSQVELTGLQLTSAIVKRKLQSIQSY